MFNIHAKQALTENGWQSDVQISVSDDGRITAVGPQTSQASHTLDLVLPAPTNLHSHAFQRAMSGLTEGRGPDPKDSFWTWRKLMYRFLDQLTPDQVEAIASLVFMEMLEAGYGSVVEFHYLHHDVGGQTYENLAEMSERIVAAADQTGIGLTLLPVLYQFGGCDRRPLAGGQKRFSNDPEQYLRLHEAASAAVGQGPDDFNIGVAPHSLRAVDTDGMASVIGLGDGPIHMHLAEQVAEVEEVLHHRGARPTEWLLDNYDVNKDWCLIHCTQMNSDETRNLAKTGAVAGLCPITESNLGDGIFNGTDFLSSGGTVGFGSDSNVHISLFDELRVLEYSQRLRDRSRAALATREKSTGRVLFEQATLGGRQAAGRECGVVRAGAFADLIGINTLNHRLMGRRKDVALDTMIFGGHGQTSITDVWSAGRHVVRNSKHTVREKITNSYVEALEALQGDL